jgi:hypothetical protein
VILSLCFAAHLITVNLWIGLLLNIQSKSTGLPARAARPVPPGPCSALLCMCMNLTSSWDESWTLWSLCAWWLWTAWVHSGIYTDHQFKLHRHFKKIISISAAPRCCYRDCTGNCEKIGLLLPHCLKWGIRLHYDMFRPHYCLFPLGALIMLVIFRSLSFPLQMTNINPDLIHLSHSVGLLL